MLRTGGLPGATPYVQFRRCVSMLPQGRERTALPTVEAGGIRRPRGDLMMRIPLMSATHSGASRRPRALGTRAKGITWGRQGRVASVGRKRWPTWPMAGIRSHCEERTSESETGRCGGRKQKPMKKALPSRTSCRRGIDLGCRRWMRWWPRCLPTCCRIGRGRSGASLGGSSVDRGGPGRRDTTAPSASP